MQSTKDLQKIAKAFGGMPIWGCIPGSPCHRAGVVYGDILLEVNGQATDSVEAYVEAKKLDPENFRARILRHGEQIEVTVPLEPVAELDKTAAFTLEELIARTPRRFRDEGIN